MQSHEASVWMDERWCGALESHHGKKIEELLQEQLDNLIQQLPRDVRERISGEILKEEQELDAKREANRRFSVANVTIDGKTSIFLRENGEEQYLLAHRLRRYISDGSLGPSFLYPEGKPITEQQRDIYVAEALNGSPRVVGVYDINFDKGEFAALNPKDGWHFFRIKDASAAIYHATRKKAIGLGFKEEQYYKRMEGKELPGRSLPIFIRGTDPLAAPALSFSGEVEEMDNLLNFYVDTDFDVDAVFGTNVNTFENDDWINVYANYDLERGCVCDTLAICLDRSDGDYKEYAYRLTEQERQTLLPKMDAYCKERLGVSLDTVRAEYLAEAQGAAPSPEFLADVEAMRGEMHRRVDERFDQLTSSVVLGDGSAAGSRCVPLRNDLAALKGKKPEAVILPDKTIVPVKTWREAALVIMRDCCADPERQKRLMDLRGQVFGNRRLLLGGRPDGMDVPLKITDGLYMEGKFDTGALLRVLTEKLLPLAGYDYQGTLFQLRGQEQSPEQASAPEEEPSQEPGMQQTM